MFMLPSSVCCGVTDWRLNISVFGLNVLYVSDVRMAVMLIPLICPECARHPRAMYIRVRVMLEFTKVHSALATRSLCELRLSYAVMVYIYLALDTAMLGDMRHITLWVSCRLATPIYRRVYSTRLATHLHVEKCYTSIR